MEETFPDRHPALICGIVNTTALDAQAEFYSCSRLEKSNICCEMLRRAGIKYVTCYHRGGALRISSLTRCGHAWLSEDPVGGRISITV